MGQINAAETMARSSRGGRMMLCVQLMIFLVAFVAVLLVVIEHRFNKYLSIGRAIQSKRPGYSRPIDKNLIVLFLEPTKGLSFLEELTGLSWSKNPEGSNASAMSKKDRVRFMVDDIGRNLLLSTRFDIANLTVYVSDVESEIAKPVAPNMMPMIHSPIAADIRLGPVVEVESAKGEKEYFVRSKCEPNANTCDAASLVSVSEIVSLVTSAVSAKEKEMGNGKIFSDIYAFVVESSMYTDYGEYAGPAVRGWDPTAGRTWKSGERTPHVVAHTLLTRPKRFRNSKDARADKKLSGEWREWWWNTQGPISEMTQPRSRYIRSFVLKSLMPNTPQIDGIVIESWPSHVHFADLYLFMDATNILGLVMQLGVMMRSLLYFHDLSSVTQYVVGEYIVA